MTAAEQEAVASVVALMREVRDELPADSLVGRWLDEIGAAMARHLDAEGTVYRSTVSLPCEHRRRHRIDAARGRWAA